MGENGSRRKIRALTAIVQTMNHRRLWNAHPGAGHGDLRQARC